MFSFQKYLNRASESTHQFFHQNRRTSHRITQATGVGIKRRSSTMERPWYEQYLDIFDETYAKTIELELQSHGGTY